MRKKAKRLLAAVLAIVLLLPLLWWENNSLMTTEYEFGDAAVPAAFDGYRILQVSDLHNCLYGEGQERLLAMTGKAAPDCIVITGDLIENNSYENALAYLREAVKLAPIYYVPGNHEANAPQGYARLKELLPRLGVTLLEDAAARIQRGGAFIEVLGIRDPAFFTGGKLGGGAKEAAARLARLAQSPAAKGMSAGTRPLRVLLSHRPELMEDYKQAGVDLVFSGHTHGGLIRLPGIGAPYGLNQGFLPKYTEGLIREGNTAMVVSRGAGNNFIGQRINNRPELVVVTLRRRGAPDRAVPAAQK